MTREEKEKAMERISMRIDRLFLLVKHSKLTDPTRVILFALKMVVMVELLRMLASKQIDEHLTNIKFYTS